MKIEKYFKSDDQKLWLDEIGKCDWRAGKHLYEYLRNHRLKDLCGEKTEAFNGRQRTRLFLYICREG